MEGSPVVTSNNSDGIQGDYSGDTTILVKKAFTAELIPDESAEEAYNKVLTSAGAIFPDRDAVDKRIISDTKSGTAQFEGKYYKKEYKLNPDVPCGIIDSQSEVGGWPILKSAEPPGDKDKDGMPDEWETKMKLNPEDAADGNKIAESGYTYMEEYVNGLVEFLITK